MKSAEEILEGKGHKMVMVDEDTPLVKALNVMNKNKIGAILVTRKGNIVGIWTERDLMKNCTEESFDPQTNRIGDYMNTDLQFAGHDENAYVLLDKFLGKRLRHLLIKKGNRYIGILSTGDVIRACMLEKDQELKALNAMVSWEYYENWKWDKSKVPPIIHNEEGLRVDLNPK